MEILQLLESEPFRATSFSKVPRPQKLPKQIAENPSGLHRHARREGGRPRPGGHSAALQGRAPHLLGGALQTT